MRFLKNKIALAAALNSKRLEEVDMASSSLSTEIEPKIEFISNSQMKNTKGNKKVKRKKILGLYYTSEASRATKNIVKNYGRAICSFAVSHIAFPYLNQILKENDITLDEFIRYVKEIKDKIDGLYHFRSTILVTEADSPDLIAKKKAFAFIGEIFIKYFSVNWIFNSRVFHKEAHLKFRFRLLRRIRNPEFFTYLKDPKRDDKKTTKEAKNN